MFDCWRGGQPPKTSSGTRLIEAFATAVTVFVTPGPGGHERDPGLPRQLAVGVRHVHRRALVADVDDAHAEPGELVPDRLDVAALEAEHAVHAVVAQEARDQVGDDGPRPGPTAPASDPLLDE